MHLFALFVLYYSAASLALALPQQRVAQDVPRSSKPLPGPGNEPGSSSPNSGETTSDTTAGDNGESAEDLLQSGTWLGLGIITGATALQLYNRDRWTEDNRRICEKLILQLYKDQWRRNIRPPRPDQWTMFDAAEALCKTGDLYRFAYRMFDDKERLPTEEEIRDFEESGGRPRQDNARVNSQLGVAPAPGGVPGVSSSSAVKGAAFARPRLIRRPGGAATGAAAAGGSRNELFAPSAPSKQRFPDLSPVNAAVAGAGASILSAPFWGGVGRAVKGVLPALRWGS